MTQLKYDEQVKPRGSSLMSQKILVVEDEHEVRDMLSFTLTRAGFDVVSVETAEQAIDQIEGILPALVVIDWMLPGMSGLDLARRLRRDEHTRDLPLIMLTARGEETDKLRGFDQGIDDYITKPFSPRELIARMKALLRRSGLPDDGVVDLGELRLDLNAHQLYAREEPLSLGATEFRLMELFMTHPGRAFTREQLLDRVWGRSAYVEERTVDVHILRLRRVLAKAGLETTVETLRGVGYRFTPPT